MSARMSLNIESFWVRLAILMALSASILLFGGFPQDTYAQNEDADTSGQVDSFVPEEYEYEVKSGNNLTILVRRALQLFDQAKAEIQLSEAQMIYCETNIVQSMGAPDLIYPGDAIKVDAEQVADFAASSQDLTPAQTAAWQFYADQADFELAEIQPANVVVNSDGSVSEPAPAEDTTTPPTTDLGQADDQEEEGTGWYWWLIGAGSAAVIWYVLWRRPEDSKA